MKKTALVFLIGLLLVACAPRGVLHLVRGADVGEIREVYVASNRVERIENSVNFSAERGQKLSFARLDVSVPPVHRDGKVELPARGPADPAQHFVLSGAYRYPSLDTFIAGLNKAPGGRDEVIVFVHGFNTNFAEAAYRLAQMAHDFDADVPVISFSWPSGGDPRGYAYDRDSVIQSRDALESLLIALARDRKVMIVAHSMGSQLVMEVLRQVSIANQGAALRRISGVALISPDIDPEVFVTQARRIKPFPQPFILMTSTRDKILDFSAWVAGRPRRLGAITSAEGLEGLPVIIVDLTAYSEPDGSGHDTAYTAPRAIELLRGYDPRH
ncbi:MULTISPECIES: alpha/beta hydrolase [unclassified Marinovum]